MSLPVDLSTNPLFSLGISNLCTICHVIFKDTDSTHSIFSILEEFESPMNLIQALQSFSNFNICKGPQMVCTTCYGKTIEVYKFIQMCNKAHENILNYWIYQTEIKVENDDDIDEMDLNVKIEEINNDEPELVEMENNRTIKIERNSASPGEIIIPIPETNFLEVIRNEETDKGEQIHSSTGVKFEERMVEEEESEKISPVNEKRVLQEAVEDEETSESEKVDESECSISDTDASELEENEVQTNKTKQKKIKCTVCHKVYNIYYMPLHMRMHTGEKPHKCEICNKTFALYLHLKNHQTMHSSDRPFTCEHCGKTFKLAKTLKNHLEIHPSETPRKRPYKCEICNKGFTQRKTLHNHRSTHSNERPFSCQHCSKSFKLSKELKSHLLRMHATDRPYKCEICNKTFAHRIYLKRHESIHSNDRPSFICHCGKAFKSSHGLSRHEKTHENE